MARKPKNNADYRPAPAKHGKKMEYMEKKYRNDGYAVWNKILDQLCDAENHYLDLSCQMDLMLLASHCLVGEELLIEIIEDLVKLKRLNNCLWENKTVLFDQKLIDSLGDLYEKRKNKCITLECLCDLLSNKCTRKQGLCPLQGNGNTQTKLNKTKLEESKVNKSKELKPLSSKPDIPYEEIINDLNLKANTNYKHTTESTKKLIRARWKDFTLEEFKTVHTNMCKYWLDNEMATYVRPDTLYTGKFDSYLNYIPPKESVKKGSEWL